MKQIAKAAAMLVFLAFEFCEEENLPEPEKIIFLRTVSPATASGIQSVLRKAKILRFTELNYLIPDLHTHLVPGGSWSGYTYSG